jgi:TonB-linked SusC/RagA family outer membrane protein
MRLKLLAFLLMLSFAGYSQSPVKGKVTDENGQALPGVSVLLKGSSSGTVTDINGDFALQAVATDGVLVFSFIGYTAQEVVVGGQTAINIKLLPDVTSLQEVVVIGYGTSTVKELTGAVSSVRGADLTSINPVRMDQALQGQAAGVQITSASGSPGGALNIRIRGLSTNGNNNPLILVDGVIYSPEGLNALNPADIQSVDILKDASAAIYGVLAANGVIFVTTKQGKKNTKPVLDFNGYYGVQETSKQLGLLNAKEFAVLKNEAFAAGGQTPLYTNVNLGKGTDWQKEVFGQAPIQNYNLNINGGSDKSTYSIGGSFLDQKGIIGGDKASYRRYNARFNFTTDILPRLTLQSILLYTNEKRHTLAENGIGSVLYNTINASPLASVKTPEGKYTYLEEFSDIINPMAQMANTYNQAVTNKLVGKEELTYKISKSFELAGRAGYNYAIVDDKTFSPLVYYGSGKAQNTAKNEALDPFTTEIASGVEIPVQNRVTQNRTTYLNYNFEAFLNFNKTLSDVHKVKGTIGTSLVSDQAKNLSGTAFNIPYNSWEFADISGADGTNLLNSSSAWQSRSRLLSYFMRGQYSFKDRYLVSAILRRDASTKFGANNRFGYFPSISAAWLVSDMPFFSSSFIQFMKVRASHGVIGNDRIGNWGYRALLGGEGVYPFNDQLVNGVAIGVLGNQDLKWETTHQTDFGIDLNFFKDKISLTADYYVKTTKDLLFTPDVSGVLGSYGAGGSAPTINAGSVRNRGVELVLSYADQVGEDFHFNISYNITTIKNKVISLPHGVAFLEGGAFGVGGETATRMEVGKPIGYFFGYKTTGVYQNAQQINESTVTQDGAKPGDLIYVDQDGDGNINFSNDTDKTMIGSPIPDFTMGLNVGMSFKGFDFSTLLYASIGNEILRNYERQQPLANLLDYRVGRWTGEGSTNENPRLTTAASRNNVLSDYFVEDGSYLRIKNIQLGYTLPAAISNKIGASKLRIYIAANNLKTFTRYKGFDPDFSSGSPLASGIDYGFYPQARTFMAGVNFNF